MSAAFSKTRRRTALAAVSALLPIAVHAQDRLVGTSAVGTGITTDVVQFGGNGYGQPGAAGRDSIRLRSIAQLIDFQRLQCLQRAPRPGSTPRRQGGSERDRSPQRRPRRRIR